MRIKTKVKLVRYETATNLKDIFKKAKLSLRCVARLIRISPAHLCDIVNGRRYLTAEVKEKLNELLKFY